MTDFNWKGLPDVNDPMFLHRVKESIEMLTTQRGGAKTVIPQGTQDAISVSKQEAIDQAVLATNHFIDQQDGDGVKTELVFVNDFDWFKYGAYRFVFDAVNPLGGDANLFAQISFDSGATWITTSTYNRYYVEHNMSTGAAPVNTQANGTAIRFNNLSVGRYLTGEMIMYYPSERSTTLATTFHWHIIHKHIPLGNDLLGTHGFGVCTASQLSGPSVLPVNGIKFFFGGTPVIIGKIQMIGIPRA